MIDLFAGPGGLSEGFSSLIDDRGQSAFKIRLSIEKDPIAHQTLRLRAFYRQFPPGNAPEDYYRFLRREISQDNLYASHRVQAEHAAAEAWNCSLGKESAANVRKRIADVLGRKDRWVLIGGPPCQAYSLAGRSRNMGICGYDLSADPRQKLYVDYLQVIADHAPAVFVMENVKGLLSAKVNGTSIFEKILGDLRAPREAIIAEGRRSARRSGPRYVLHSLNPAENKAMPDASSPDEFVVRAERHGIPQCRHRLIIVGVRSDIRISPKPLPVIALTHTQFHDGISGIKMANFGTSPKLASISS